MDGDARTDRTVTSISNAPVPGEQIMHATGCRVGVHAFVKITSGTSSGLRPFDTCGCGALCYDGVPASVSRWWSRDNDGPWVEHRR